MNRIFLRLSVLALVTLSACGGIDPNVMRVDNDGNGKFSGTAGENWTPDEIAAQVCGPNSFASVFRVLASTNGGAFAFAGECASGQVPAPGAVPTPQPQPAPVTEASAAPSQNTSGSSYVSPYEIGYQPPEGFYDT